MTLSGLMTLDVHILAFKIITMYFFTFIGDKSQPGWHQRRLEKRGLFWNHATDFDIGVQWQLQSRKSDKILATISWASSLCISGSTSVFSLVVGTRRIRQQGLEFFNFFAPESKIFELILFYQFWNSFQNYYARDTVFGFLVKVHRYIGHKILRNLPLTMTGTT